MAVSASATGSRSPSTWMPTIACRRNPTVSGSVTATICITPWSSSFWTRWRTAASDRPTALPIAAYGRRPSSWSCSMIARETASIDGGRSVRRSWALRFDWPRSSLCTTTRPSRKPRAMKFVVHVTFRELNPKFTGVGAVESVASPTRVGCLTDGHVGPLGLGRASEVTTELRRLRNYIDGEFRDAADGRTIEVVNPATGEAYATVAALRRRRTSTPPWRPPPRRSRPGATPPPPSASRCC